MSISRADALWTTLSAALLGGLGVGTTAAYVRLPAWGRVFTEAGAPSTEVGVVLGAQVYPTGVPSPFLAARLDVGLRLYRTGKVRRLIVSGDDAAPEYDEPRAMRRYLLDAGMPAEDVVEDPNGFDTYESCLRARDVYRLRRFTLISQTYHLPRAVGTARLLGLDAIGVGDDSVRIQSTGVPSRSWRWGVLRDWVACVKTVRDLRTRTSPARPERPD